VSRRGSEVREVWTSLSETSERKTNDQKPVSSEKEKKEKSDAYDRETQRKSTSGQDVHRRERIPSIAKDGIVERKTKKEEGKKLSRTKKRVTTNRKNKGKYRPNSRQAKTSKEGEETEKGTGLLLENCEEREGSIWPNGEVTERGLARCRSASPPHHLRMCTRIDLNQGRILAPETEKTWKRKGILRG